MDDYLLELDERNEKRDAVREARIALLASDKKFELDRIATLSPRSFKRAQLLQFRSINRAAKDVNKKIVQARSRHDLEVKTRMDDRAKRVQSA